MYFIESLTWEVCIIGLSLSAFTLVNILFKSQKHKSDLLLCLWLVLLNIPLLHTLLHNLDLIFPTVNVYINPTLNLLHGPILYLYIRTLISQNTSVKRSELLHILPFALFYLLFITMPHHKPMRPGPKSPDFLADSTDKSGLLTLLEPLLVHFGVIIGAMFIAYSIAVVLLLRKHQKNITGILSRNDNQITLKWLYALPITFAVIVVLNFLNENYLDSVNVIDPLAFHMMSFLSFIILLCFFGVKQRPVFYYQRPLLIESNQPPKLLSQETNNNDMSDTVIAQVIEKMKTYMENEKPYLNPDFSVYALADALNTPRRTMSQVLNNGLSKNFYQFVNEYRIEEVRTLLESSENKHLTILDIAFQSGFKSKSSFNSLFKQHCGMTPSQYRKQAKVLD